MEKVGEKMEEKVWQFMQKQEMITEKDRIVAGISGGGDSMALLFLLQKLQKRCGFALCAVHVNHGIRGEEAALDEQLVESYCAGQGIPFWSFHYPVPEIARERKWSQEEAGRKMRHKAYGEVMRDWKGTKIALAHHKNDQAETVLHHLARGCGLRGIAGILPVQGRVIRPFLCIERKEIDHYLSENQIPFRTDSSNRSDRYIRNRIRNHVVDYLENHVNSAAVEHLAKTAGIAAEADAYLSAQAEKTLRRWGQSFPGGIRILSGLQGEPHILQIYVLMAAVEQLCGLRKDLSGERLEQILGLFSRETGKQIPVHAELHARRDYDGIVLEIREKKEVLSRSQMWELPAQGQILCGEDRWETRIFEYKFQKIPEKTYTKWFDYDRIKTTLQIRNRRPGDYLVVNARGGRKKLKDYLIDEKVPRKERENLVLLAADREILWIVGMRISEAYKITESTRRVLEVKYQGGRRSE